MWSKKTGSGAISTSYEKNSSLLYAHQTASITQIEERATTLYRGLTQSAAEALVTSLYKDETKAVFYYGQTSSVSESVITAVEGTKTNARAERADESNQWQVTAETTTYSVSADANYWKTSPVATVTISESGQFSKTFVGYWFKNGTIVTNTDGSVSYWATNIVKVYQKEETVVQSVRSSTKGTNTSTAEGVYYLQNLDKNGGLSIKNGTRITVAYQSLSNGRGWVNTTTTTTFSVEEVSAYS